MKNIFLFLLIYANIWGQVFVPIQRKIVENFKWSKYSNDITISNFKNNVTWKNNIINLNTNFSKNKNTSNLLNRDNYYNTINNGSAWEKMNGPFGGSVRHFYKIDNELYVITDRDVFFYGTNKWKSLNVGDLSTNDIYFLYKGNNNRFLLGTDSGLWFSYDNGKKWEQINLDGSNSASNIFKTETGKFLLSTSNGIYISNGDNTKYSLFALKDTNIYSINVDSLENIWACTQFGILKANLSNLQWENVGLEGPYYPKIIFDSNGIVYTYSYDRVLRSRDEGKSWEQITGLSVQDISLDSKENLLVTTPQRIIILNSDGLVWESQILEDFLLTTLFSENEFLLGTLGAGAKKYDLKNDAYYDFSTGMNASTIRGILPMKNGNILAYTDANIFYISKDLGLTWEPTSKYWARCFESGNDGTLYIGAAGGIIKSEDFGKTWQNLNIDVSPYYINALDISPDNKTICAGSSIGEVYVSSSAGMNFLKIKEANYNFVDAIKVIDNQTYLIADGSLYYTNNGGKTFITIQDSLNAQINVTDFIEDNMGYIYLSSNKGLFRSLDGVKWRHLSQNISAIAFLEIDKFGNLYASSTNGTVYFSHNQGEDWEIITEGIYNTSIWSFAITSEGYIFIGSQDRGLFRTKPDVKNTKKIQHIDLSSNFPNPFNASTRIEYMLPKDSFVELEVYDLLGRKVETLIDEYEGLGKHFSIWNPVNQSSGIYFYRLKIGADIQVKKMILLK